MMPSTPRYDSRGRRACRAGRAGFTLTEMLVVIGIIVLVLSIATPMVTRAWRSGDRARMSADLQAISTALEAYRQDHGMYPRVAPAPGNVTQDWNGARMLCRALIGPGPEFHTNLDFIYDGAGTAILTQPGPGFRTRKSSDNRTAQGQVHGPYLKPDLFKMVDPAGLAMPDVPGHWALMDRYNRPILYYSANGKPNVKLDKGLLGDWDYIKPNPPKYNVRDNAHPDVTMPVQKLALMLGDYNMNGKVDVGEEVNAERPFLLWSAGPDEQFGPVAITTGAKDLTDDLKKKVQLADDVTNFRD